MTIEQLRYFMALTEYKSFSLAAEKSYVSQPTLSKQIKALEEELGGIKLFERNTKQLEITDAGREFYVSAEIILTEYHRLMENMEKYIKDY